LKAKSEANAIKLKAIADANMMINAAKDSQIPVVEEKENQI